MFFRSPLPEALTIVLGPDRAALSAVLQAEWGIPDTACWRVATGVADFLGKLSSRA
jgi:hypothetical protein